jgi:hypothetical protein
MDPDGAAKAFAAVKPYLDAQLARHGMSTKLQTAVVFAAALGRKVRQPEMRARFVELPDRAFPRERVDLLESAALATWYASLMHKTTAVQADGFQVPREIVAEATTVKQRMLKVLAYHFDADPETSAEIADIRKGSGYEDLSTDLARLAWLYERHEPVLARDAIHYRREDRSDAGRLAHQIQQILGDGHKHSAAYWADYVNRAWSFLIDTYNEVSVTGRWLYRHEGGDELFPSLYTAGRNPPKPPARPDPATAPTIRPVAAAAARPSREPAANPTRLSS